MGTGMHPQTGDIVDQNQWKDQIRRLLSMPAWLLLLAIILLLLCRYGKVASLRICRPGQEGPENVRTPKDIKFDIRSNHTSSSLEQSPVSPQPERFGTEEELKI